MSDERRYWHSRKGSSNATGGLLAADRMALKRLPPESSAPALLAFFTAFSGPLGLLLGALAVATIAGWRLLRRRARKQQRLYQVLSHARDEDALLPACAMGPVQQSPVDATAVVHLKLQRRARLESLLRAALDDQVAPLDFLPMGLAHQLRDGGQWIADEEARPLFPPDGAWAGSGAASPASAGAVGSRRWGLASHSLHLMPGAIQVSACYAMWLASAALR